MKAVIFLGNLLVNIVLCICDIIPVGVFFLDLNN